jgi:hypothetical protein
MHMCHANVCVNLNICLAKNVKVHDLHLHTQQQCKAHETNCDLNMCRSQGNDEYITTQLSPRIHEICAS